MKRLGILSGNDLKIIALVTMLIDHMALLLMGSNVYMHIVGRLSFPIFAFMIAEGARYTKNKLRYALTLLLAGAVSQFVYSFVLKTSVLNIIFTFLFSVLIIYALDLFKMCLFNSECKVIFKILSGILFASAVLSLYLMPRIIGSIFNFDFYYSYGFYGAMCAAFASAPSSNRLKNPPQWLIKLDTIPVRVLCMAIPLFYYSIRSGTIQMFSLLSLVLLLFYSGKKGDYKIKYLFYIFYPAHLLLLYLISLI